MEQSCVGIEPQQNVPRENDEECEEGQVDDRVATGKEKRRKKQVRFQLATWDAIEEHENKWGRFKRATHLVKACFQAWRRVTERRRRFRWVCVVACKFKLEVVDRNVMRRVLVEWYCAAHSIRLAREQLQLQHDLLQQCLHTWSEFAFNSRTDRSLISQADKFSQFHLLLRYFQAWRKLYSGNQCLETEK